MHLQVWQKPLLAVLMFNVSVFSGRGVNPAFTPCIWRVGLTSLWIFIYLTSLSKWMSDALFSVTTGVILIKHFVLAKSKTWICIGMCPYTPTVSAPSLDTFQRKLVAVMRKKPRKSALHLHCTICIYMLNILNTLHPLHWQQPSMTLIS